MRNRMSMVGVVVALVVSSVPGASAQTPDTTGRGISAMAPSVTSEATGVVFATTPLQQATESPRKHDSPWNGLLIGAVLGAALGFGTYTECTPEPPEQVCGDNFTNSRGMETATMAALFGAVGLTLDLVLDAHAQRAPAARPGFSVGVSRTKVQAQFGKRF